jgi:hypothetical protein
MRRGEIWTVAAGAAYTGKPRPAVIVQDDRFDAKRLDRRMPLDDGSDIGSDLQTSDSS